MQNTSGIRPIEFNVLLLPDEAEEVTKGGLVLPQSAVDRGKHAATKATIVACSPMAFNEDVFPQNMDRPAPGQRVIIAQHAGTFIKGDDGAEYRLVKDKDVVALME